MNNSKTLLIIRQEKISSKLTGFTIYHIHTTSQGVFLEKP